MIRNFFIFIFILFPSIALSFSDYRYHYKFWNETNEDVLEKFNVIRTYQDFCLYDSDDSKCADFIRFLETVKKLPKENQIYVVNSYVNSLITYKTDKEFYGVSEYWASPYETFIYQKGDCEDYALLKFYILNKLGFTDLKILVVTYDYSYNYIHAVLIVNHNNKNYILDNAYKFVYMDYDATYHPIYSIDKNKFYYYYKLPIQNNF